MEDAEAPLEGVVKGTFNSSVSAPTSLSRLMCSNASAANSAINPVARSFPNIGFSRSYCGNEIATLKLFTSLNSKQLHSSPDLIIAYEELKAGFKTAAKQHNK
ncbi:hypothetical protein Ccrd_004311, partial [Cynara cardunculus var. scolymus]